MAGRYYRGTWASCFGLAVICLVFTYFVFGFYFEEYEALFDGMLSDKFSPCAHFDNWYYMGHIGLGSVYAMLYSAIAHVEWMSVLLYTYLAIAIGLVFYTLHHYLAPRIPGWALLLLCLVVYVACVLNNTVLLNYTRVACFMAASALLALVVFFSSIGDIKQRPYAFVALMLFLCLAIFTRLEASIGVIALLFFFALAVHRNIRFTIGLFIVPTAICVCLLGWIVMDSKHTTDFYKQIEPDVESQLTVRNNLVAPVMLNATDSLKFEAARNMLWSDPAIISNRYLRSLIGNQQTGIFNQPQWTRTVDTLQHLLPQYWLLIGFNLLMLLALLLQWRQNPTGWWLLYNLAFWLLILAQTYFVKIEERAFEPFLSIYTLGNLLLWAQYGKWEQRNLFLSGLVFVGVAAAVQVPFILKTTNLAKEERATYQANTSILKQAAGGKILLLNSVSYRSFMLQNQPLIPFDATAFHRVYMNEVEVLPLIHPYREYLEKECACDVSDFSSFFRYLQHQDKEVYMLTSPARADLVKRYLHTFHGFDIRLQEVTEAHLQPVYDHEHNGKIQLVLYRLGK